MEPQLPSPGNRDTIQTMLAGETRNQAEPESPLSNAAGRSAMRVMTLGGIMVSLFTVGPMMAQTEAADVAIQVPGFTLKPGPHRLKERRKPNHLTRPGKIPTRACVEFYNAPSGLYVARDCEGDPMAKMHESKPRGYMFGAIQIDGKYKCVWGKVGSEPLIKPAKFPHKVVAYCQGTYRKFTDYSPAFIKDLNGKKVKDGTATPQSSTCTTPNVYGNFATANQSPLNVLPNGTSGFDELEGTQPGYVYYRYVVPTGSAQGHAAIVRGHSAQVSWGYEPETCIPLKTLISAHANNTPGLTSNQPAH